MKFYFIHLEKYIGTILKKLIIMYAQIFPLFLYNELMYWSYSYHERL
jgi:hypothetical protein